MVRDKRDNDEDRLLALEKRLSVMERASGLGQASIGAEGGLRVIDNNGKTRVVLGTRGSLEDSGLGITIYDANGDRIFFAGDPGSTQLGTVTVADESGSTVLRTDPGSFGLADPRISIPMNAQRLPSTANFTACNDFWPATFERSVGAAPGVGTAVLFSSVINVYWPLLNWDLFGHFGGGATSSIVRVSVEDLNGNVFVSQDKAIPADGTYWRGAFSLVGQGIQVGQEVTVRVRSASVGGVTNTATASVNLRGMWMSGTA